MPLAGAGEAITPDVFSGKNGSGSKEPGVLTQFPDSIGRDLS
jgi:hypothetical protein